MLCWWKLPLLSAGDLLLFVSIRWQGLTGLFVVDVCTPIERHDGPDVLKRATVRLMLQGHGGNVAYAGHLGGAAVGALAFVALRRGRMR